MELRRRAAGLLTAGLGVVVALLALLPMTTASAHAFLTSSSPGDGTEVTTAPSQLRLDLSESVVLDATRIELTDGHGRTFTPTSMRLEAGDPADTEEPSHVIAALPALPRGAYRVAWQTLSSDDLHRTSGVLVFGVGAAVHATPFVEPLPRPEEAALRWLLFGCVGAAVGGQLGLRLYRRAGADHEASWERYRRLTVGGAGLGLLAASGLLLDQVLASGTSIGSLIDGPYGQHWAVRTSGLVLLLAAGWRGWGRGANPVRATSVLVGAGAVGVGSALLGHSGAGTTLQLTRVAADAAHLVAAATWAGLLLVVGIGLVRRRRAGADEAAATRAVLRGFRVPAATAVAVLGVTGVYLAGGVVGSVDAALLTTYGQVLLLKIAVVAVIGVLGLVNTRRLHARPAGALPRRTVLVEATLAVLVLGLAAVLTAGQPAREPRFTAVPAPATVPLVDAAVADLQESLAVRPNVPGRNVALVEVHDARRPALAPVTRVLVSVVGANGAVGTPVVAERVDTADSWSAPVDLPTSGGAHLQVVVQRAGVAPTPHRFAWTVGADPHRVTPATVSNAPIDGVLTDIAIGLAVLAVAAGGAVVWRSRRRADGASDAVPPGEPSPSVTAGDAVRTGDADDGGAATSRDPELTGAGR